MGNAPPADANVLLIDASAPEVDPRSTRPVAFRRPGGDASSTTETSERSSSTPPSSRPSRSDMLGDSRGLATHASSRLRSAHAVTPPAPHVRADSTRNGLPTADWNQREGDCLRPITSRAENSNATVDDKPKAQSACGVMQLLQLARSRLTVCSHRAQPDSDRCWYCLGRERRRHCEG